MCVWNICVIPTFSPPQLWLASGITIGQTLKVQVLTSVKAQEQIACGKDLPQFDKWCLLVRQEVFIHTPSPQVSPGKWKSLCVSLNPSSTGWSVPVDRGVMEAEIPVLHACGTFSQVPPSAQIPLMGDTFFTLFLKGRAGSWRCFYFCFNVSLTKHLPDRQCQRGVHPARRGRTTVWEEH